MLSSITKRYTYFYQSILVTLTVMVLGTIIYFWNQGYVDGRKVTEIQEAHSKIDEIKKGANWIEVKKLTARGEHKEALALISQISDETRELAKRTNFNLYKKVAEATNNLHNEFSKFESLPSEAKIISNLEQRIQKFQNFVTEKKWKTLSRTAERMLGEVKNDRKLEDLAKNLRTDLDLVIDVTSQSSLSDSDKHEVNVRIEEFDDDIKMLKDMGNQKEKSMESLADVQKETSAWVNAIYPYLSEERLKAEQIGRYYMLSFLGILGFLTVSVFGGFFFNVMAKKSVQKVLDKEFNDIVSQNLIGKEKPKNKDYSESMLSVIQQTQSYLNKRMSFGYIFQDTLPFPSLMLDQNLRVIWTNQVFAKDWQLSQEEISHELLTWDYLAKMTNLGEEDPVLDAIKTRVGGIYQMQVRPESHSEGIPYEMYVTPVEVENDKRLMLYFYPLGSMNETISEQSRRVLFPVKQMLHALVAQKFDAIKNLKNEFEAVGLSDLYQKFREFEEITRSSVTQLENEIHAKSAAQNNNQKMGQAIAQINNESLKNYTVIARGLKGLKEMVIKAFTQNAEITEIGRQMEFVNENLVERLEKSARLNNHFYQAVSEFGTSLPQLENVKNDYKRIKNDLMDARTNLSHSLSQLVVLKKKMVDVDSMERFTVQFERVTRSYRAVDELINELDRKMSTMDVCSTKLNHQYSEVRNLAQTEGAAVNAETLKELKNSVVRLSQELDKFSRNEGSEAELVSIMKEMFEATKGNIANARSVEKICSPSQPEINA